MLDAALKIEKMSERFHCSKFWKITFDNALLHSALHNMLWSNTIYDYLDEDY